jgi:hypothetical protein
LGNLTDDQGMDMKAIMKTREERREELKLFAAMPNGIDKLYSILTRNFVPFEEPDHDNQHGNDHFSSTGHQCNSPLAERYPLLWPSLSTMKKS